MKNKVIKTEVEYDKACKRVYEIIQSSEAPINPESKIGEELELISLLIENYEKEFYSLKPPTPIEAIKFRMEQLNVKQADIAPLFGGKTRISEVLNGKRPLTLKMISLLHKYLDIPLESLISENPNYSLSDENKHKIFQISSIRDRFKKDQNIAIA